METGIGMDTVPHTIGPFVIGPKDRGMTPQERYHEGFHARKGGLAQYMHPRAQEEDMAYEAEKQKFPDSVNPYRPNPQDPRALMLAKMKQAAEAARMQELMRRANGMQAPPPAEWHGSPQYYVPNTRSSTFQNPSWIDEQ
jgi:hypothetical protein